MSTEDALDSGATGTVAALPPVPAETPPATAETPQAESGFGPLEDPPKLDGVKMIGEPEEHEQATAADSSEVALAESESPVEEAPSIDPALLAIDPALAARANEIANETAAIGEELTQIEHANGTDGLDEADGAEETGEAGEANSTVPEEQEAS